MRAESQQRVGAPGHGSAAIPPYIPFQTDLLPAIPRDYVRATAGAMNCDPSYSALPALALLGAAIGTSHAISPKAGWREPPFVFGVTVGQSGSVKSPPYRDVESIAEDVNDELEREHEAELEGYELRVEVWEAARDTEDDPGPRPRKPGKRALFKSDVTIEALVGVLQDNPRGVLVGRDELSGWIGGFTKYSGKSGPTELPQWLQLSNAGTINYTRKTGDRRQVRVRGVGVSVCGTTQPGVLARAMTPECREAGLLARLLLAYPPRRKRVWTEAEIDEPVRAAFSGMVKVLFRLPAAPASHSTTPCPHVVGLSTDAKAQFVAFFNANGEAMETAEEDEAAARSKLEGYALRFALIFHCCRHLERAKDEPVGADDMRAAIALTEWFVHESARVYALLGETGPDRQARELARVVAHLAARPKNAGRITARDLQNHNSRKYATREAAEAALLGLVARGLGDWDRDATGASRRSNQLRYFRLSTASDTSDTPEPDQERGEAEAVVAQPVWRTPGSAPGHPPPGASDYHVSADGASVGSK